MKPKRGRPTLGAAHLSRERIFEAALALVDSEGLAALSMRQLAATLGVDPMAIYHYVPNKRAVLGGIVALALAEFQLPARAIGDWQTQVRAFAAAYRAVMRRHPELLRLLVSDLELGAEALLQTNEHLYAALAGAGLSAAQLMVAADTIVDYLHGVAFAEGLQHAQPDSPQDLRTLVDRYPAVALPIQRRILAELRANPPALAPIEGLDLVLLGIRALLTTSQS